MSLDVAHAYTHEPDREESLVIDDPDVDPTKEVVMHVYADGGWHKLIPNHQATACGGKFDHTRVIFRPEKLEQAHLMCLTCFTDYERLLALDVDDGKRRPTLESKPIDINGTLEDARADLREYWRKANDNGRKNRK